MPINTQEAQMTFSAGASGSSDLDAFNTADALGRPLYAQQIETSGGSWDTTQMGYSWNGTGRVTTKTMPCATTKGSGCSNGTTTVTHDALGRPLVTTDGGGGTITNTYTGHSSGCGQSLLGCLDILSVVGPAPAGEVVKQVQKEYNGLGQLMSVCQLSSATGTTSCQQANGGTGFLTTYSYNADGTLASVVRGSQMHSFTYDALGRTLTATYPESGTKYFYYDSAPSCSTTAVLTNSSPLGNLDETYDSNGTTACFSYDTMNRNTSIAYAGTRWDGENKYFVYDAATVNGSSMTIVLGRLAEAFTAPSFSGTKATDEGFSYTGRGELAEVVESTPNSGGYYTSTASYFANGVLSNLLVQTGTSGSYTTVFKAAYGLDGKGRANTATEGTKSVVTSATYNPANEPCLVTFSSGDTDSYAYDNVPCTGLLSTGRMSSYQFTIGSTPTTLTGSYAWNSNGAVNATSVVDNINSDRTYNCAYGTGTYTWGINPGYGDRGELASVVCQNSSAANIWGQTFTYDAYGNITKSVPTGDTGVSWIPGYNSANNYATGNTYDSNGNTLTDPFVSNYKWNQDNHPVVMGSNSSIVYDALGRRVEYYTGSYRQPVMTPVGPVVIMQAQALQQFRIPLPGGGTGTTGVYVYHAAMSGTVPLVSNLSSRNSVYDRVYAPYGEIVEGPTGALDFTGDFQDLVTGIYDTPNRELGANMGRWTSPDPAHASWNAYSYTTNPLVETDPSGLNLCGGFPCSKQEQADYTLLGDTNENEPDAVKSMENDEFAQLMWINYTGWDPISAIDFSSFVSTAPYTYSAGLQGLGGYTFYDDVWGQTDNGNCYYALANPCGSANISPPLAANNGPQLLPSHQPTPKPACSAVYNQFVTDMNALNAKYALGWQEAAGAGVGATIVTQPSLWGMAYRIGKMNERILGFIGLVAPTVIHTGVAAATDEGQERRALASSYAQSSQQCDPTR
ncbi:MAG: RHS repeat-associated core domain-containing protein [Terriglobales bacterium]